MSDWPLVDPKDDGIRPAGPQDACLYCKQKIGNPHRSDCVIVQKRVRLRYCFVVDVSMPHAWTPKEILAHRNQGTWCADNAIEELEALISDKSCLCDRFKAEFVDVVDDTPTRGINV